MNKYKSMNVKNIVNIVGNKYNNLTVLGYSGKGKWCCRCDCSNVVNVLSYALTSGRKKTCGCLRNTLTRKNGIATKEYIAWQNMKARCYNKKHKSYLHYGGRGIVVDKSWLDSFKQFLEDMGESPNGYQIERLDNDGNYNKDNCIWASVKTQSLNRRTNNLITYKNKTKPLKQWCDDLGLNYGTICSRVNILKWSYTRAFETKIRNHKLKTK